MSVEHARLFIEKMKSDEAFAKRVMAIEDVAERLACIQSEGFDCSEAEIKEVSGELSDEDMDGLVGGGENPKPDFVTVAGEGLAPWSGYF
jgi:predicted ribosomally synthesized peptide with nif11-like leader